MPSEAPASATMVGQDGDRSTLTAFDDAVRSAARRRGTGPLVVGICGSQGSGKSTLAVGLAARLAARDITAAILSLDDLYLTRSERITLARDVHPLLRTRGVPGTHDVALGLAVLDALDQGHAASLPRFDKSIDDRAPEGTWAVACPECAVLILEGWCVGAIPQMPEALATPVNALERDEDPDGIWRTYANNALGGVYQRLFSRIDFLALLAAPGFDIVRAWRLQQEEDLKRRVGPEAPGVMDEAGITRFIQHYERLTRHILTEMPDRADMVVALDEARRPVRITRRDHEVDGDPGMDMLAEQARERTRP